MSLCDHLNSKTTSCLQCPCTLQPVWCLWVSFGCKKDWSSVFYINFLFKNLATEIQLRTRNVSNHMWSKCPSSTMKTYPYSTQVTQSWCYGIGKRSAACCIWLYPRTLIRSHWYPLQRGQKKCGGQERFEILGIAVAYMMMSFFLQQIFATYNQLPSFTLRMSSNSN